MSVQAMTWAYAQTDLTMPQKLVLITLCNFADMEGWCYPGQKRLAADCSTTVQTVRRALTVLCERGLIEREHRQRSDGSRTSDMYQVMSQGNAVIPETEGQGNTVTHPREHSVPPTTLNRQEEPSGRKEGTPPLPPLAISDMNLAVMAWNEMAGRAGLSQVQKMTDRRKAKLRARLADCGGLEGWQSAMDLVKASPFLCGDGERGWKANFDFVLQERSFTKLMEGGYAGSDTAGPFSGNSSAGRRGRNGEPGPLERARAFCPEIADGMGAGEPSGRGYSRGGDFGTSGGTGGAGKRTTQAGNGRGSPSDAGNAGGRREDGDGRAIGEVVGTLLDGIAPRRDGAGS